MLSLENKQALVCGSSQGIGRAIAVAFAKLGARVTLLARNAKTLREACSELSTEQGQHHDYLAADFTNPQNVQDVVRKYLGTHKPFHLLINNTGGPSPGDLLDADPHKLMDAFSQHVVINQLLTQILLPGMKKEKYGRIINIVSTSVKQPIPGLGVSNVIRGAVASWAKTLANELGPYGITVNNILPGSTNTQRLRQYHQNIADKRQISLEQSKKNSMKKIPLHRFAETPEIAYAACYLASPLAAYVTGIHLPVDGGKISCL